jgi:hypothetical protein
VSHVERVVSLGLRLVDSLGHALEHRKVHGLFSWLSFHAFDDTLNFETILQVTTLDT